MSDAVLERVQKLESSHGELTRRVFGNGTKRGSIDGRLSEVEDRLPCFVTSDVCEERYQGVERRETKQLDIALVMTQVKASSRTQIIVSIVAFATAIAAAFIGRS